MYNWLGGIATGANVPYDCSDGYGFVDSSAPASLLAGSFAGITFDFGQRESGGDELIGLSSVAGVVAGQHTHNVEPVRTDESAWSFAVGPVIAQQEFQRQGSGQENLLAFGINLHAFGGDSCTGRDDLSGSAIFHGANHAGGFVNRAFGVA